MKVTVDFDGTKIVVPCGDGVLSVRELSALAGTRYRKAVGGDVHTSNEVAVVSLQSREGGMLDPDDLICDVCDDRELIKAVFFRRKVGPPEVISVREYCSGRILQLNMVHLA